VHKRRPWQAVLFAAALAAGCAGAGGASPSAAGGATAPVPPAAPPASASQDEGEGNYTIAGPYDPPPEATVKDGVPRGKLQTFPWTSTMFADTTRDISVYIPAQYQPGSEAALLVLQDGPSYLKNFKLDAVLDNLIARKQVPVMIAVFIANGGRPHRSQEYDTLNTAYARFVLEEILPEVERRFSVKLTTDPEGRAIGGHSSGGIAAFTVGWERPDQFHRILTHNGSFTDIRGGDVYPSLVRTSPPKPLRVFLLSGTNDLKAAEPLGKSWPKANQEMASALADKGYRYRFVFAKGGTHDQKFAASVLPETLVWLWRGYPR
jgi:enterochelin esterase family protein